MAVPPSSGRAKLDPRYLAMSAQARIPESIQDTLGDKDVDTAALFGFTGEGKKDM